MLTVLALETILGIVATIRTISQNEDSIIPTIETATVRAMDSVNMLNGDSEFATSISLEGFDTTTGVLLGASLTVSFRYSIIGPVFGLDSETSPSALTSLVTDFDASLFATTANTLENAIAFDETLRVENVPLDPLSAGVTTVNQAGDTGDTTVTFDDIATLGLGVSTTFRASGTMDSTAAGNSDLDRTTLAFAHTVVAITEAECTYLAINRVQGMSINADSLTGTDGEGFIEGLNGNDNLNGKSGNDVLIGNAAPDTLVGEAGNDVFAFNATSESRAGASTRDFINGFVTGQDQIDLSGIDACTASGDQAFTYVGSAAFSGDEGELRWFTFGGGNYNIVEANVDGDRQADLQIFVNQANVMVAGDFIL